MNEKPSIEKKKSRAYDKVRAKARRAAEKVRRSAAATQAATVLKTLNMEPFVDIDVAAVFTGLKVPYLYEQAALGNAPSHKAGKYRRFRLSELERWMMHNGNGAADPLVHSHAGTSN
jgi:hypothetical protein